MVPGAWGGRAGCVLLSWPRRTAARAPLPPASPPPSLCSRCRRRRKVTVSTVGVIPRLLQMAEDMPGVRWAQGRMAGRPAGPRACMRAACLRSNGPLPIHPPTPPVLPAWRCRCTRPLRSCARQSCRRPRSGERGGLHRLRLQACGQPARPSSRLPACIQHPLGRPRPSHLHNPQPRALHRTVTILSPPPSIAAAGLQAGPPDGGGGRVPAAHPAARVCGVRDAGPG